MKSEKPRGGAFSRIISVVTHNWWLKLLSLILAIVVYHSLKTDTDYVQNPNERHLFQYR